MTGNALQSNVLEVDDRSAAINLAGLAQALRDSIPSDKAQDNAYRVIDYLARQTIERSRQGKPTGIATKDIHIDLEGNRNQGPSAWMSPLWKKIKEQFYPQIEEAVIRRCREAGYSHYPQLTKQESSPALYLIEAVPIEPSWQPISNSEVIHRSEKQGVEYEPDLSLRLSWIGSWVLKGGLVWTRYKKLAATAWLLLSLLGVLLFSLLLWVVLAQSKTPLSARDLMQVLIMIGAPWFFMRRIDASTRVFEDRIVIAPDWVLAWKEFGATLELEGEPDTDDTRTFKVTRYTASCPVCRGMVKLDRGDPDFPRRLVGRCSRSPREHVFSFDRVTRSGGPLICPP